MVSDSAIACAYELDAELRIRTVDAAWSAFAQANEAPELAEPGPLGRPVLGYIQDATTVHLYRRLFDSVQRTRRPVAFSFRCDGPEVRRFLEMEIRPGDSSGLRLHTRVVRVERRAPNPLLERGARRGGAPLRMCSWCKAVDVEGRWCEVEQAVIALRLFEDEEVPAITHGICPQCYGHIEAMLG
jgi:hypothetical protein